MRVLLNYIFVIIANTYQLIDTTIRINERPFYISGRIEDKTEIYNAVNEYNKFSYFYPALLETNNKEKPHIRIEYGDLMGATYMIANTNSGGYFELDKTVISFNKKATGNTLQCIILHEILHTQMIYHNDIEGSIMNYTVFLDHSGNIIEELTPCKLNIDDVISLIYKKNIY
jgi:hypothetical protein